jgi:hypothetical protein
MHFAISNPLDFDDCRAKPVCVAVFLMIPKSGIDKNCVADYVDWQLPAI